MSDPRPLFHLGYTIPADAPALRPLGDTRFVLVCGSARRAAALASHFAPRPAPNLCRTDRFTMHHPCAQVLVASHGIGMPSLDVLLHEVHTLLHGVGAVDWTIIRVGICGGIGVEPGSVIISTSVVSGGWTCEWRVWERGQLRALPVALDGAVSQALYDTGRKRLGDGCRRGVTLCAETFYGGQGRGTGGGPDWARECESQGVVGVEMEGLALGAFASRVGVRAGMVLAVLVDRRRSEIPAGGDAVMRRYEDRAVAVAVQFVRDRIAAGAS